MKKLILLNELKKYPVFNTKIVSELTKKQRAYSKLIIFRLKKEGLIFEIERDKYSVYNDPLTVASRIAWPSYISLWSAFRFYNMTEQLPQTIFVITTRSRRRKIKFSGTDIIFTKASPKYFFGFNKQMRNSSIIFIACMEKAIIDSLLFRKISISEIIEILENNIKIIDIDKLIEYLLKIKNKSIIKRIGYILDKNSFDCYFKLKQYINNKYILLEHKLPYKGEKNKKWKVIDNVGI